jgi:hypothetical protein
MTLNAAVVLTTIGDPALLDGYFENFRVNGRLEQVRVIVTPDRKTPKAAFDRCALLAKKGLSVICPTLEEQECFLRKLGLAADFIPYDSDNRRNIGYLIALEGGCDFLVSIDDDNWAPTRGDFFGEHAVVCAEAHDFRILEASGGWFNLCSLLNMEPEIETYPRGFPYFARHEKVRISARVAAATVRINGGLWTQHPDLDAMSWLNAPVKATAFRGTSFVLDRATWAPINTQNTAVNRSVIPSYYFAHGRDGRRNEDRSLRRYFFGVLQSGLCESAGEFRACRFADFDAHEEFAQLFARCDSGDGLYLRVGGFVAVAA